MSCHLHISPHADKALHFLHGNGFAVRTYEPFLENVVRDESLMLQDAAGHGMSPAGDKFIGWNASADRFLASLTTQRTAYGLSPMIGVGHSFGGCMTMLMSEKDPELFEYNILLDPALYPPRMIWLLKGMAVSKVGRHLPMVRQTLRRRTSWTSVEEAFDALKGRGTFTGWEDDGLWKYVQHSTRETESGERELCCPPWLEAAVFGSAPKKLWRTIRRLKTPTYILWGTDTYDTFRESYLLAQKLNPNIHLVEVKGGHCFMQQYPEQAARLVRSIIDHGKVGITDSSNAEFIVNYDG